MYTDHASIHCGKWGEMVVRRPDAQPEAIELDPLPSPADDGAEHRPLVVRGQAQPDELMSLENNLIVVEILDAARESAALGRAVRLTPN